MAAQVRGNIVAVMSARPTKVGLIFGPKTDQKACQELEKNDQKIMQKVVPKVVHKFEANVLVIRSIVAKVRGQKMVRKDHKN